jgi:hypothetical protein
VFGAVVASEAVSTVLAKLMREGDLRVLGLWSSYERLGRWMLGVPVGRALRWDPEWSLLFIGAVTALSLLVCALRIRRLEVVA